MKIAIEREHHTRVEGVLPEAVDAFERAVGVLEAGGARTIEVVIPHYEEITFAGRVQSRSEAAAYHMLDLRTRWSDYGVHTRDAVGQGALYSASDVVQAQRVRQYGKKVIARADAAVRRAGHAESRQRRAGGRRTDDGVLLAEARRSPRSGTRMGLPALCIPDGLHQ